MSNKKAVVKIGADVEEAKKGIDSISSQVDDPPKIAGRYTPWKFFRRALQRKCDCLLQRILA